MQKPDLDNLVARVLARLAESGAVTHAPPKAPSAKQRSNPDAPIVRKYKPSAPETPPACVAAAPAIVSVAEDGVYSDPDAAVRAAQKSYDQLTRLGFNARFKLVAAMRAAALENIERWSHDAVAETGMGRVEDKIAKNRLVTERTPGPEYIQSPEAFSGSDGTTLNRLDPWGVIAAIAPCTNSTETIINNGIGMIAAGNAAVFNAHPVAKKVSADCIRTLNAAIAAAGGPKELLCCVADPSIESAQALMAHPLVTLLVVTGGGAVVEAAMKSNKRAICAGPGNPPAVVDETACIQRAAACIARGASLDNNVVCTDEKAALAVAYIADELKQRLLENNCVEVPERLIEKLTAVVLHERGGPGKHGAPNKRFVGKNAAVILREIGMNVDDSVRLAIVDVERDHPLLWTEQLMPVLPLCRLKNADEAIALAVAIEAGRRHTASIHTQRLDRATHFSAALNCSICVVNASNFAGLALGGEGYTSFSIATPTGEGLTTARTFSRFRRLALCGGGLAR